MLDKLLQQEKEFFNSLIANRHGVRESMRILSKEHPEVHIYGEQSFYAYVKSDEGKASISEETDKLREDAKTHSFAHRGSRVSALVEIGEKLLNRIRRFKASEVGSAEYTRNTGEFRKLLQDVKAEVDFLGLSDTNALDIFAAFTSLVQQETGLPSFVRESLDEGNTVIITDPINES